MEVLRWRLDGEAQPLSSYAPGSRTEIRVSYRAARRTGMQTQWASTVYIRSEAALVVCLNTASHQPQLQRSRPACLTSWCCS